MNNFGRTLLPEHSGPRLQKTTYCLTITGTQRVCNWLTVIL